MLGLAIFSVLAGLAVSLFILSKKLEKKRTVALRAASAQMGLSFAEKEEADLQSGFAGFSLFSQGRSETIRNIMYGRLNEVEVMLFDYSYTTGSGKNRSTYAQTVGFFQSDTLHLPEFLARPEGLFQKIGQVFGYQDIDLPLYPEFSRRYLLRGVDEGAISGLFKGGVAVFFEKNPGLSIEAKTDRFILYRQSRRLKPEEWRGWLEKGWEVFHVLRGG